MKNNPQTNDLPRKSTQARRAPLDHPNICEATLSLGLSVAALTLLGAHSAMAAIDTMTASDPGGTTSFNTAGKWLSGNAPTSGIDYFTSNFEMRGIAPGTFAGDSLTISSGGALHG